MKSIALLVALLGLTACKPEIGQNCATALDCSATGNRLCDTTQRGGYCTIPGCDKGSCPEEAVCVRFRPEDPRLSVAYCMYACEDSGDCRDDEGYRCLSGSAFGREGETGAKVLDGNKKFCAQPAIELMSIAPEDEDAGLDDDGGTPDGDGGA